MRVPFIVYADFESFYKAISECQPDPSESYTNKYQKHTHKKLGTTQKAVVPSFCGHLFIKNLHGENGEKINCIPTNEEKYISFSRDVIVDKFINEEGKKALVKR